MTDNPYSPPYQEPDDSQPHLPPQEWLKQVRLMVVVMLLGAAAMLVFTFVLLLWNFF